MLKFDEYWLKGKAGSLLSNTDTAHLCEGAQRRTSNSEIAVIQES